MRPVFMKIFTPSLITIVLFSCSKISNSNNTITCNFGYTTSKPLSKDQQVQYTAGVTGTGGTITEITYLDSAGTTVIQNPTLPFVKYVNLKKAAYPSIGAKGTANLGGQIVIYIGADSVQNGNACNN
jgi:hypothetical protein